MSTRERGREDGGDGAVGAGDEDGGEPQQARAAG